MGLGRPTAAGRGRPSEADSHQRCVWSNSGCVWQLRLRQVAASNSKLIHVFASSSIFGGRWGSIWVSAASAVEHPLAETRPATSLTRDSDREKELLLG